ncbi:ATP-grasp domain-containing protein [Larkinella insperata]|uniref:ATP-grasp domain-containing protein n=1 Tax=Larkinella insperata TaxID=332158 RepID=A0ABW3QEV8_9BACT
MKHLENHPVALLYQAAQPPVKDGLVKPMKPGGYSDSGADIAYALQRAGIPVITPVAHPDPARALDWVFPDTKDGIDQAVGQGAQVIWLNTVLFEAHPIQDYLQNGGTVVGQDPGTVEVFDDKWHTNQLLKGQGLPIPGVIMIRSWDEVRALGDSDFPRVVKPIRGRGSAGVTLVENEKKLTEELNNLLRSEAYGNAVLVEDYLPGQEITVTVMPPGSYTINGQTVEKTACWSLPPVRRFNHEKGVAPYNGTVAVTHNSAVLSDEDLALPEVQTVRHQCEKAAQLVGAKAPIRIDCRQDEAGRYFLFDLNMKPNMTGAGRPGRADQDSLSALAARHIGWSYADLLLNMLAQSWNQCSQIALLS